MTEISTKTLSYADRVQYAKNPVAKKLFQLMEKKRSNLSVAVDVTSQSELLQLVEQIGSEIVVLKTHIDILEDFDDSFVEKLQALAKKFEFVIFEDRKFADIGNTVFHQYTSGIYRIADWADIVNAHLLPGPGIIEGLQQGVQNRDRGLLLLAQMSSQGNLFTSAYTQAVVDAANTYENYVIGFICMEKISNHPGMLHMTPGVNLATKQDNLRQQYQTPEYVILNRLSDIIIVGRDIYRDSNPEKRAQLYRQQGWDAYSQRLS